MKDVPILPSPFSPIPLSPFLLRFLLLNYVLIPALFWKAKAPGLSRGLDLLLGKWAFQIDGDLTVGRPFKTAKRVRNVDVLTKFTRPAPIAKLSCRMRRLSPQGIDRAFSKPASRFPFSHGS